MVTLVIDTALSACSAAIMQGAQGVFDKFLPMERGHAEAIGPLIAEAFAQSGYGPADLDAIGVVTGPGAFAGVRVGIAFARGLAIGRSIPVLGITSLAALDATARRRGAHGPAAVIIDARRGDVYAGLYGSAGEPVLAPFAARPAEAVTRLNDAVLERGLAPARVIGPGAGLVAAEVTGRAGIAAPSARDGTAGIDCIDPLALGALVIGADHTSADRPVPLYIRPPDAAPGAPSPFAGLVS